MQKTKVEILQKVRPRLADLERRRKKMLDASRQKEMYAFMMVIVGIALLLIIGINLGEKGIPVGIFGVVGLAIVVSYYVNKVRGSAEDNIQQEIGEVIMEAMGGSWSYKATHFISPDLIKHSGLTGKNRAIYGKNLIEGKHGDTQFSFSNINISSEGHKSQSDVFGGMIVVIDFHKNLQGKTLVFPDLAQNTLGSWLGKKIQSFGWKGLNLVYLEDPIFEKFFAVYSTDQVEARYILTPHMMSNMLLLKEKYGHHFSFSFMQGTLLIAIDNVSPFESSLNVPILPDGTFYHFNKAIDLVTDVIDILQLNTRIWSKQ